MNQILFFALYMVLAAGMGIALYFLGRADGRRQAQTIKVDTPEVTVRPNFLVNPQLIHAVLEQEGMVAIPKNPHHSERIH